MPVKLATITVCRIKPLAYRSARTSLFTAFAAVTLSLSFGNINPAHAEVDAQQPSDEPALTITLPPPTTQPDPSTTASAAPAAPAALPAPDFQHLSVRAIGSINQDGAQIVRRAGASNMQVLFTCAAGQNIGVVGQIGEWYCVMMADNTLGCILAERVNLVWQRAEPDTGSSEPARTPALSVGWRSAPSHMLEILHSAAPSRLNVPTLPHAGPVISMPSGAASRLIENAMRYIGVPYVWGGNTNEGIDCSGLVKAVFSQEGIQLPRTAREQAEVGTPVTLAEAQPGDRLSFACHSSSVDHTGIYIGNGKFIEASGSHGQVCITKLEGAYLRWLVGIHRDAHS